MKKEIFMYMSDACHCLGFAPGRADRAEAKLKTEFGLIPRGYLEGHSKIEGKLYRPFYLKADVMAAKRGEKPSAAPAPATRKPTEQRFKLVETRKPTLLELFVAWLSSLGTKKESIAIDDRLQKLNEMLDKTDERVDRLIESLGGLPPKQKQLSIDTPAANSATNAVQANHNH